MTAEMTSTNNPQARSAERRQVTALSYDLVGSTRLAALLDPEDMQALQRSFHELCTNAISRFDGYVGRYSGDGAMAYFGYPRAHEDDPERAIRAGLAIVAGCQAFGAKHAGAEAKIAVRVGIATGLVVAGDFAGDKAFDQNDVVGIPPNLAFKLQAGALANSVVISSTTRELTVGLFQCRVRPPLTISGFDRPQPVWEVLRARSHAPRSWRSRLHSITPLAAREEEIATVRRRWERAEQGEGQIVLLSGEPGIGKSRIAAEIRHHIARRPHFALTLQCSSQRMETAFHPLTGLLERVLRLALTSAPEAIAERLAQLVGAPKSEFAEVAHYIARLLTAPAGESEPALELDPEQVKQKTMAAIMGLVERMSRERPMLIVCEDVHWIDPTSQELLDFLIEAVSRLRVLVLITFRPGYDARCIGQPQVTLIALNRLDERHCAAMISFLAHDRKVHRAVVDRIIALADGVPLYVEELSRTVFGVSPEHSSEAGAASDAATSELAIPATLADSLTARLDQLGPGREIVQICSVIGRSFTALLVFKLVRKDETSVERALEGRVSEASMERALEGLVSLGLASMRGHGARAVYTFRHALIQESAYRSILRRSRQAMHRRVAELLASDYAGSTEAAPEILAHHYEEAGEAKLAVDCLRQAAQAAAARSANVEAVRLLERALRLLANLPKDQERDRRELSLLVSLGPPQIAISGTAAPEVQKLYGRAIELCGKLPNSPHHFAAHWGWWFCAGDYKESLERANRLSSLTAGLNDEELELQAHHCQWATQFSIGEHARCCDHIARGLALYERGDYRAHAALYGGHDPKVCGLGERGLSQWLMGQFDQSLASIEQSIAHARTLQHGGSIGHSLHIQMMLHQYRGDGARVLELAGEITDFAEKFNFQGLASRAKVFRGWAMGKLGDAAAGMAVIEEGLAEHRASNSEEDFPVYFEMLAEAYGAEGEPELGLPLLDEALSMAERSGLQYWTAELLRRKGVLLLQQSSANATDAVANFQRAIEVAEAQGARTLLLRAMCDKTRIAARSASRAAAKDALASLLATFSEGRDCADLRNARSLIEALS
jgi:predicted ATPase/class 3 adenylate cyclase